MPVMSGEEPGMSRSGDVLRYSLVLCVAMLALLAVPASARAYELDPVLSLTGDCTTDSVDPVPDPGCPGGQHPSERFSNPNAVAVDPYGNEYVSNVPADGNGWIDVFDDEGNFITEVTGVTFPKNIAVDSGGTLYVFSSTSGDLLRYSPTDASQPELGIIEYEDPPVTIGTGSQFGSIAVDPANDQLLVARSGVVFRYSSATDGNVELNSNEVGGSWSTAMAIDGQRRRLYVTYCAVQNTKCGVKVLDADTLAEVHEPLDGSTTPAGGFAGFSGYLPIAVDEETGEILIGDINRAKTVYLFSASYAYISQFSNPNFQSNSSLQMAISNGEKTSGPACVYPEGVEAGDACNRHYLFVPVYFPGRVLAFRPPDQKPPLIKDVFATGISETEAELQATIKPNGLDTTYSFEYLTQQKYEEQGEQFTGATLAGGGTIAGTGFEVKVSAQISDLQPGTAYRFRVVAENELGPATGADEGSFTTYSDAPIATPCPNEALRTGPSALLPDCRAYELVTPPSTNGREPKGLAAQGDTFTTVQAAPGGDAVSFRIEGGSLPGTTGTGGFNGDPYITTRTQSGWTTALAGPSGSEATVTTPGGFSADQGYSFWIAREEGSAVIDDGETHYVRYPDGHSELIGRGSLDTDPSAKGNRITEGGTHIIFETRNFAAVAQQLEPEAPPTGTGAVYDRTADEVTHVVSLLPGEITPAAGKSARYVGSSPDGAGIAFQIDDSLYLRKDNAVTYGIGAGVSFAGVSEGGERIFYVEGGDLLAYDTTAEEVISFSTTGDVTPVNVATGGERAAFVSPSVLGGANPEGDVAQPGAQNLYLSTEGQIEFVATVTDRDVEGEPEGELSEGGSLVDGLGLWTEVLLGSATSAAEVLGAKDPSRLNPSGSVLLFQSRADLTGYDPDGFPEVYRYDSDSERLHCLSCIPTGTPANGGGELQTYSFNSLGQIPLTPVTRVPNLTPSGDRVFFESTEALVSADTDEVRDVYEWEEQGIGGCARAGGCVYLISSGHSGRDNYLYGHSTDGDDVFFTTGDVLNGFDGGGTVSIYDARVNGGFPEPVEEICAGEGCRPNLSAPPTLPTPESGSRSQSGNPPRKKRCPKGKRKVRRAGKVRCVRKHHKPGHHKKAGTTGRAGR
jgi:hypothetical protein